MSGRISRRKLLGYGGLAGAAGVMGALPGEPGWLVGPAVRVQSTFVGQVFRREDQLSLTVEGVNLRLAKVGEPGPVDIARLVRVVTGDPETYLIVHFGPQALAEHAYLETDVANGGGDETSELTSPTAAALSFGSRLAFKIPPTVAVHPPHMVGDGRAKLGQPVPRRVPWRRRQVAGLPPRRSPRGQRETLGAGLTRPQVNGFGPGSSNVDCRPLGAPVAHIGAGATRAVNRAVRVQPFVGGHRDAPGHPEQPGKRSGRRQPAAGRQQSRVDGLAQRVDELLAHRSGQGPAQHNGDGQALRTPHAGSFGVGHQQPTQCNPDRLSSGCRTVVTPDALR